MNPRLGVLHVILNPGGGAWSMLRELAGWQAGRIPTAIGIGYRNHIPEDILEDLRFLGAPSYFYRVPLDLPHASGIFLPPLKRWHGELSRKGTADAWITHFHSGPSIGLALWPSLPGVPRFRSPAVNTYHGVPPRDIVPELRGPLGSLQLTIDAFLSRRMQRYGVRIVSLSPALRSELSALYGLEETRISVVSNGVGTAVSQGCPRLGEDAGGRDRFTIGYIGCIERNKGWEKCVNAATALRASGKSVRLMIVGDGPEKSQLMHRVSSEKGFIEYLGSVPRADRAALPCFDTLVLPSLHEGQPMVILEAFACGVPVIASAVGGIPDTISHGSTGFLLKRRDGSELAHYLGRIYDDPDLQLRMSRNCRAAWQERFGVDRMGESYLSLYQDIYSDRNFGL